MTSDFNDWYVAAPVRAMAQRVRSTPRYLITAEFGIVDASMSIEQGSFASCYAVIDDFGNLVQVTPWL